MRHHKILLACLVSVTLGVAAASAKAKKTKPPVDAPPAEAMIESKYLYDGDESFKDARAKLVRSLATDKKDLCPKGSSARTDITVTSVEAEIQKTQPDFFKLRDEVLAIKKKEQIDAFIKRFAGPPGSEQRKNYEGLDMAARMLVLQLRSMAVLKSFFFRAKEYVGTNSITRTTIVSMLRAQAVGIQNFTQVAWGSTNPFSTNPATANNSQIWEAAYNYMTEPMDDMGPKINTDKALENFLATALNEAISINNDFKVILEEAVKSQSSIWWDNKLFLTIANFVDPKDRYMKLGIAELLAIRSGLTLGVSSLQATTSYSFVGFLKTIGRVGELMGYDVTKSEDRKNLIDKNGAEGLTSKNRFDVLREEGALFEATGDAHDRMVGAYTNLRESVFAARDSYDCLMKRTSEDQFLFDVRFAQSMNRIALNSLGNLVSLFDKKAEVNSTVVSGEKIEMNLWAFYSSPPKHLKDLYPTQFNDASNKTSPGKEITVAAWDNVKDKMRNYKFESARAWKATEYKKLFPSIHVEANGETTEVGKYARILSQTWGSAAFAIPLSAFVF